MKTSSSITIAELYPKYVEIPILGMNSDANDSQLSATSPGQIDSLPETLCERICQSQLQAYLHQNLGLDVAVAYPTDLKFTRLISQLVTGFVLNVATIRIAFIPSEDLDYDGLEIEQEWVDLSNWAADYYVPVQVDLEGELLHLWGFISYRDVKEQGAFDRIARTYTIDSQYLSDDLDDLWLICELIASGEMLPERAVIPQLPELLPQTAQGIVDTLRQHDSIFSPRLDLAFAQWGGILNQPKYLELYLNPVPEKEPESIVQTIPRVITRLSDWLDGQSATIYADWKSIRDFFKTPQLSENYRSINLVEQLTICPQHNFMYRSMDTNTEALADIIENSTSQNERWDAIESLWVRDPNHSALPIYKLLDLSIFFQGEQLSLLVSIVPTKAGKLGILMRLSPNREQTKLPLGINLSLLAEDGQISREIIAQDGNYQCLQLIFDADFGDLFSICVTLNGNQLTKHFQV
jgi:Protein of unknown function (DUF1822)